jgi:undecaprenyl-diphosphatase
MKLRDALARPARVFAWLGGHERGVLIAIALIAAGAWMFVLLAGEVMEGDTQSIDTNILLAMRNPSDVRQPLGPPALQVSARDVTALGGVTVLGFLTAATGGFLILDGKRRTAFFLWGSVVSGLLISTLLKGAFHRQRPDVILHATYASGASFPSGHSMMSAVTYLTIGALVARSQSRRGLKAYFLLLSILLTLAVGVSRVYLGVHWPTDVLAGWTAGAVWAILCWAAARWLQRRHAIEEENESAGPGSPPSN